MCYDTLTVSIPMTQEDRDSLLTLQYSTQEPNRPCSGFS